MVEPDKLLTGTYPKIVGVPSAPSLARPLATVRDFARRCRPEVEIIGRPMP